MRAFLFVQLTVALVAGVRAQSSLCVLQDSCDKCLTIDASCSWCTDNQFDMRKTRCMSKSDLLDAKCREEFIEEYVSVAPTIARNEETRDFTRDRFDAVQIQPQHIKLNLKKNHPQTIKMVYKPAKNYPLDLYYLMDLTWTMKDDKETLVNMGGQLASSLSNLTQNYRLGYGSFADKPKMPFILPGEIHEKNPCNIERDVCEPTYGFRHRLQLTEDISEFIRKVNASEITGNLDNLEGGLDALMQILVCNKEIGWDDNRRKIVVFATDGQMHFAGDGLLAGIVARNDKKCHLSDSGEYAASLELDYPSLEEIFHMLVEKKVNIIFAVTQGIIHHYDRIHSLMNEISSVGILKMDSSNILQLVETGYNDFIRKVQFTDNSPDFIDVTYETTCGGAFNSPRIQSRCDNVEFGKEYEFLINVTLKEYPPPDDYHQIIKIEESSLSSEDLTLDIDLSELCNCMTDEMETEKLKYLCSDHGNFDCGTCSCEPGWAGRTCECDLQDFGSSRELENLCREPIDGELASNITAARKPTICSDRGECFCGECWCNSGFSGKYCECFECPFFNGEECGGPSRANCDCGVCTCKPGWTGDRCDCLISNELCFAPNSNQSCSEHGKCSCGLCTCEPQYYGKFCETSMKDESTLCSYYEPCVKCLLERKEGMPCELNDVCKSKEGVEFQSDFVKSIVDPIVVCNIRITDSVGNKCDHQYNYFVDHQSISNLRIVQNKCTQISLGFMSMFVAFATFLLGLLFICAFKIYYVIRDKEEYAKFEKSTLDTEYKFMSPIYKSPVTRYENPMRRLPHPVEEIELK